MGNTVQPEFGNRGSLFNVEFEAVCKLGYAVGFVYRVAADFNHFVNRRLSDYKSAQYMRALLRLGEVVLGPSAYNVFLMFEVVINKIFKRANLGRAVNKGEHYKSVGNLQVGMLV